jgi:hypothetical protein
MDVLEFYSSHTPWRHFAHRCFPWVILYNSHKQESVTNKKRGKLVCELLCCAQYCSLKNMLLPSASPHASTNFLLDLELVTPFNSSLILVSALTRKGSIIAPSKKYNMFHWTDQTNSLVFFWMRRKIVRWYQQWQHLNNERLSQMRRK